MAVNRQGRSSVRFVGRPPLIDRLPLALHTSVIPYSREYSMYKLLGPCVMLFSIVVAAPLHAMMSCEYVLTSTATVSSTDSITNTTVTVHYSYYTWACDDSGSSGDGSGGAPPSGGGTSPAPGDPPGIGISGISDENPEAPIMTIYKTSSIASIELYLDNQLTHTLPRSADSVILPSLRTMPHGKSIRLVGRTSAGLTAETTAEIVVSADVREKSELLLLEWFFETGGLAPEQGLYGYLRSISVLAGYTTYENVSTFGRRHGRVQQHAVEDTIHYGSPNPDFGWESEYRMQSPRALNQFTEGICWITVYDSHAKHVSHCAEMNEFTIEGTSSSSFIPGGMNSPYAWGALGPANIYQGQTITIGF